MTLTDLIFSTVNAPLTILLIVLAVYRVITMLFGMDLDFDLDFDTDFDVDFDADMDASGIDDISNIELKNETIVPNRKRELKWWQVFLIYFNFSELPFMFTFASWIFFWWVITIIGTYYTNSYENSLGLMIFFAAIIPALFLNKAFTNPFKTFFSHLGRNGEERLDLIGRTGTLLSNIKDDKLGSAKLFVEKSPINIYVKSLDGEPIESGQEILIIKQSRDKKFYYIK